MSKDYIDIFMLNFQIQNCEPYNQINSKIIFV